MRIKDICDINAFSISVNDEIDNIQYLDTSNLTENKIGELQSMLLSEAPSRAQRRVKNNTILYSTVRPNQKHYGILSNPCHNLIVSTGFATLDIKESLKNEYDAHFLYYLLTQNWVTLHLQTLAENSVSSYPSINASDIGNLDFSFPIIEVQRQLASILKNIDDKIVLNRSINRNLEALAKQLYDYWFVQFDFPDENGRPYKSSGGKMVWNEKLKRNIPKNWECVKIKEVAKTYSGGTPTSSKTEYYENGTVPWINSGELNSAYITSTSNFITELGLKESSAKFYPKNTILIALYGATAGKVSFLTFEACSNQAVCGVMLENPFMVNYTRFYLSNLLDYYILLSSGSARDNISQETIKNTWLIKPDNEILNAFDQICQKTTQLIVANQIEIDNLTMQRDELLPLLMNGQITVNSDLSNILILY
jgi:type I restriction enzyme S subunit